MARSKWTDKQFGQHLRARREDRHWTQPQMAKMLSEKCSQSVHATTIAKIEAGRRSVRINEAVAFADLFEVSVDLLLGRREPDDTTLTFALVTLAGYIEDVKLQVMQAQRIAADIEEQLEDAGERFESPHVEALQRVARDICEYLDAAQAQAQRIDSITTLAIAEAGKETQA